jgi:outer membrane protein
MTSKFPRFVLAVAVLFAVSALAQTSSTPASGSPATVASSAPPTTTPSASGAGPALKVGTINIQDAIFLSNEGRRDMDTLQKKFDPKQTELKNQNDELEALKKQLNTQQASLNDEALANLKKQIESKQKTFDRAMQDAQEDFGNQQQEIATRILQKMAPMIVKFSQDNGFGLIVDTSKPWPQSPVLWWNQDAVDITKAVVDIYNVQSGVPAPASAAAPKPTTPKPGAGAGAGATAKPAAPKTTPPATTPQN